MAWPSTPLFSPGTVVMKDRGFELHKRACNSSFSSLLLYLVKTHFYCFLCSNHDVFDLGSAKMAVVAKALGVVDLDVCEQRSPFLSFPFLSLSLSRPKSAHESIHLSRADPQHNVSCRKLCSQLADCFKRIVVCSPCATEIFAALYSGRMGHSQSPFYSHLSPGRRH